MITLYHVHDEVHDELMKNDKVHYSFKKNVLGFIYYHKHVISEKINKKSKYLHKLCKPRSLFLLILVFKKLW